MDELQMITLMREAVWTAVLVSTPILAVANKVDQPPANSNSGDIKISAKNSQGIDQLTKEIVSHAQQRIGETIDLVPTSVRQSFHLQNCTEHLQNYLDHQNHQYQSLNKSGNA